MKKKTREFLADTLAMIVFCTFVGVIIEVGIAQMPLEKSIAARKVAILTNFLTGGLNGMWLNLVRGRLRADTHILRSIVADALGFASFQAFVYLANLLIAGATPLEIVKAIGSAIVVCTFTGKPYGWCVNAFRRILGACEYFDRSV